MSALGAFQAALAHLGEIHRQELDGLRQEYEAQLTTLNRENNVLRAKLGASKHPDEAVQNDHPAAADSAVISPEDVQFETTKAIVPFGSDGTNSRNYGFEEEQPLLGDFTVKDEWNKFIETRHWGANLDAFMFASNLRPHETTQRRASKNNMNHRSLVASAAAKSVEEDEAAMVVKPLPPELEEVNTGCSIYPNSTFRLTWDLAGLVLISYDLITIPFTLAFEPDENWFMMGMDWITLLFWSGDMLQGFFLGYFEKGQYVSDNRRILRHYMMTWFIPDAVVVAPEWLMTVASSAAIDDGDASQMFKFLKGARAVRVLRLLRLLKLQRIINLLYDMIESEHTFICVNLARLLLAVLVLNHVIACIWYLIGRISREWGMRNWIEVGKVEEETIGYKYSTSLHWSLTQFTPASMDISARNVLERMFSIVVLFFAVVAFSSIVASITGSMTSLRNMKAEEMKQFWLLRRYLRQREVTPDLSDRIFKYLEHQTAKQSKLVQTNSLKATLPKLSLALQSELTHQLNSRFLIRHPFFRYLDTEMSVVMHRLCHVCLAPQSHAEKEVIFSAGDKASKMFFIKSKGNCLEYTTVDGSRLEPPPHSEDWVGEAVLWTEWRHTGRLQSVYANDLIAVDPVQFVEIMCVHPRSWFYAKRYAAKFVDYLNSLDPRDAIDILRDMDFYDQAVEGCDTSEELQKELAAVLGDDGNGALEIGCMMEHLPSEGNGNRGALRRLRTRDRMGSAESMNNTRSPRSPAGRVSVTRFGGLCPWVGPTMCEPWCNSGLRQS